MKITQQSHPYIFKAFREIELDNGMINRFEPARYEYPVPDGTDVDIIERELASLTCDEFDIFCTGEHEEIATIVRRGLQQSNSFLASFFNGEFK